MKTVKASLTAFYSRTEALRAADQLIELLQQEHGRGFFKLDNVTLQTEETSLVFSGAEYMEFARRGVRDAIEMSNAKKSGD
jgi:hypothetical protein